MDIGAYVRQELFDHRGKSIYRYGIVVSSDLPEPVRLLHVNGAVKVVFSPRKDHPVSIQPYAEYVPTSKLEIISEQWKRAT